MSKQLLVILAVLMALSGVAFAANQWCYDDSDCDYDEYCGSNNKCVSYSGGGSSNCCSTYAILLGIIGLGAFAKYKHII
ncbi:MAG: hypothetical protein QXS93_01865 [Candidatus Micrarchaeia archaeon]